MRYRNPVAECNGQRLLELFPTCADLAPRAVVRDFGVDNTHICDGRACFLRNGKSDYDQRLCQIGGTPTRFRQGV